MLLSRDYARGERVLCPESAVGTTDLERQSADYVNCQYGREGEIEGRFRRGRVVVRVVTNVKEWYGWEMEKAVVDNGHYCGMIRALGN